MSALCVRPALPTEALFALHCNGMNVMEERLRREIDPALEPERLGILASRALGRDVRVRSHRVLTGGCWNRVIAVALVWPDDGCDSRRTSGTGAYSGDRPKDPEELVFKISPRTADRGLEREFRVLDYFTRHTAMPVPRPYLVDGSGDLLPGTVLVMEKVAGRVLHAVFGLLGGAARRSIGDQIASAVCALHRTTASGFGGVELEPQERCERWSEFWMPRFRAVLQEVRDSGHVPVSFLDEVERVSEGFEQALEVGGRSTLTHYDIWSGNVMVDIHDGGRSARVTAFIDIPGIWADYARELSFMEMFGLADDALYERYRSCHGLDEGYAVRKNIYNLKMHLKHVVMYPDERYYRQGAAACLALLREKL